jgi:esterase/lipase superfamily enzyme/Flp pilus assembly protein TadD
MRALRFAFAMVLAALLLTAIDATAVAQTNEDLAALNDQVIQLRRSGKYSEAIDLAERALALSERLHGPDHSLVAISLTNLAALYQSQGRLAEAEPLYKRALAIYEKALGPDHRDMAASLNDLASLYQSQSRFAEAEPLYKRALTIYEKALGPDHKDVAASLNNLASLYRSQGSYTEAEALYRRALSIHEKAPAAGPPIGNGMAARCVAFCDPPGTPAASAALETPTKGTEDAPKTKAEAGTPYATVRVFFGTNRAQDKPIAKGDRELITFGTAAQSELALGQAVVTVPKEGRERGHIPRPKEPKLWGKKEAEDAARHFTLFDVVLMTEQEFVAAARRRLQDSKEFRDHAFVFVHGYRVSFEDATFRVAQITYDLGFDGVPFLFSWPSNEGLLGYVHDQKRALGARSYLRRFIELIVGKTGAKQLHLIAHSMGSLALLEVLAQMADKLATDGDLKIHQIILAAPDVDRDGFEDLAKKIVPIAKGVTVYASSNDIALQSSKTLARGLHMAGDVPEGGSPIIVEGIDTIDVSSISTDVFSGHSAFAERWHLLKDIQLLLRKGTRPPDERFPVFEPVRVPQGTYWKYVR